MNLFIQVRDGKPFEHPIEEWNFVEAFPGVDLNNLPPSFARFVRVEQPVPAVYEVVEGVSYEWDGPVVKDVWHVRQMTPDEIKTKQDAVKRYWAEQGGYASWVFNEETCAFDPPVPRPTDGKYRWDETTLSWVAV